LKNSIPIQVVLLVTVMTARAAGSVWHVPGEMSTIQAGINAAAAGDTILIACGVYLEHDIVLRSGITVRGSNSDSACVVIDARQQGRVMDCVDLHPGPTIERLTIRGGRTPDGYNAAMGGGVRVLRSELKITDCVLKENTARLGGGLGARESTVHMTACTIQENEAVDDDWAAGGGLWCRDASGSLDSCRFIANSAASDTLPGDGGGLFCKASGLLLSDCSFTDNYTGGGAGAFYSVDGDTTRAERCFFTGNEARWGGALYLEDSRAHLEDCEISDNRATTGGAIMLTRNASPHLEGCLLAGNQSTVYGGGAVESWVAAPRFVQCRFVSNHAATQGGGVRSSGSFPDLSDCLLADNSAGSRGGAIWSTGGWIEVRGCTIAGNSALEGAGYYGQESGLVDLERTIIAFSPAGESVAATGYVHFRAGCCNIFGNAGGDWVEVLESQTADSTNFSADPMFCDREAGNYEIHSASPCAPASSGPCHLIGAFPVGCGLSGIAQDRLPELTTVRVWPNPFNPRASIRFSLPAAGEVRITVHDPRGRLVRTLLTGFRAEGTHEVAWRGLDEGGRPAASGVYFCRLTFGRSTIAKRMTLVR
jgi:hypothetical protein